MALFYVVCCALRLARFNSMLGKLPPFAYNYFTGVPAPAGALLSMLPIVVVLEFGVDWVSHPVVAGCWTVLMAVSMASRMPTYSFKRFKVPQAYVLPLLVGVALTLAGLAGYPWLVLTVLAVLYISSFPFSVRSFYRLKAEAELLLEEDEANDGGGDAEDIPENKTGTGPQ